jgi:hypothetical protein
MATSSNLIGTILAALSVVTPAFAATAETSRECNSLIQECFAYTDAARNQCFRASAEHSACSGTAAGALAAERLALSPDDQFAPDAVDGGSLALLGPQLVDSECIEQFDMSWSSALVAGTITPDVIEKLKTRLVNCRTAAAIELPNP